MGWVARYQRDICRCRFRGVGGTSFKWMRDMGEMNEREMNVRDGITEMELQRDGIRER